MFPSTLLQSTLCTLGLKSLVIGFTFLSAKMCIRDSSSKQMLLNEHSIQSYANCSMADVLSMSNQRTSLTLTLMAMIWAIASLYYHRRKQPWNHEADMFGTMCYSQDEDSDVYKRQGINEEYSATLDEFIVMTVAIYSYSVFIDRTGEDECLIRCLHRPFRMKLLG